MPWSDPRPRRIHLNPLRHEVVSPEDLANLKHYKYSGLDHSICSRLFLQRYWTWVVGLVPLRVAPNALTLLGLCASLSSVLVVWLYGAGPDPPTWIWLYAGAAVFAYQTLDSIDGKQARRTQSGSPLGEVFDHGCDSFFNPFIAAVTCVGLGYDPPRAAVHCFLLNTGLFTSIFEQYSTGTLDLGYINAPVEGVLLTTILFTLTSFTGIPWWNVPFGPELSLRGLGIPFTFSRPNDVVFALVFCGFLPSVIPNLWNAFAARRVHQSNRRSCALLFQTALAALFIAVRVLLPEAVFTAVPMSFDLLYGLTTCFTATRLTVARLCLSSFNPVSVPFLITVVHLIGCAVIWLIAGPLPPHIVSVMGMCTAVWAGVVAVMFVHMMIAVFRQFSDFLGCNILTLTAKQKRRLGLK